VNKPAASDIIDILERLKRLHPRVIDLSLGRTERLLARLGHPERALPPVVHVAGTNGKGSVVAFVRALLEAHGARVHVYTSPHLMRFHERIVVAGEEIDDPHLTCVLEACEEANAGDEITYFEITTAAALLAFSRTTADFTLLETGLGGRLDATNVIERPVATVITPVSMDHQSYLGDTLAEIAREKAGILKSGVPCFVSRQLPEATNEIVARARSLDAPLIWQDADFAALKTAQGFSFDMKVRYLEPRVDTETLQCPMPSLAGDHQIDNAGLALAVAHKLLGGAANRQALQQGVTQARWPARLQRLDTGWLRDLLPLDWELWLDGGHNPAAGQVLAEQAMRWRDKPLVLVVGMLGSKDASGFLSPLRLHATDIYTVPIEGEPASLRPEQTAEIAQSLGFKATPCASISAALQHMAKYHQAPLRAMICGSLYLAGAVLIENGRETRRCSS